MKEYPSKKIDESLQIDTELSTFFKNKNAKRIKSERKMAKSLKVSYQTYLIVKSGRLELW